MFRKFVAWLHGKFGPVPPDLAARLVRIDDWLEVLPLADARALALSVLENPEWFTCRAASIGDPLPTGLPPTILELFNKYAEIRGRYCDLVLSRQEVGPSAVLTGFTRIGYDDEHVELCCRTPVASDHADAVYTIADDVPPAEAHEGGFASVFHAVLHAAALLDYVSPPQAAV